MPTRHSLLDKSLIVALALWTAVGFIALVIACRALAGSFDEPVSAAGPVLTSLLALCGSLTAWTLFHLEASRGDIGRRMTDGLLSLLPAGVAGFSAAVNAGPTTLAAVTGLVICGLTYVVAREGMRSTRVVASNITMSAVDGSREPSETGSFESGLTVVTTDETTRNAASKFDVPVCQQVARKRHLDGIEEIEAVLCVGFAPGQREAELHLPIYPVLRTSPHVEVEPIDDPELSARPTAVHRFGVRVTVKRTGSITQAADATVGIHITAPAASQSAA